jgi:hypothetical protein
MIDMLNKICNWTQSGSGSMICGGLFLVGGLHMILSEQQPVLGMIDLPSFTIMGKKVGVQTILGLAIAVCAGGCLMSSSIKGLMS